MGALPRPKSGGVDDLLFELEEEVKDAVLFEKADDPVLNHLIEITIASIASGRPVLPGAIIDEPYFYRTLFYHWVQEALEEYKKLKEAENEALGKDESLPRSSL